MVEFDHRDPLLNRAAITGVNIYRADDDSTADNKLLFGDNPSGEIFYVDADNLPKGGQDAIRRVMFDDHGTSKTLLQLIQEKNAAQGSRRARGSANGRRPQGQIFILNKRDGTIRLLVPD